MSHDDGEDFSMAARFARVDADNPEVWDLFERFTFHMIKRNFQHYSARAVMHRVRWETATPLEDETNYKINNNWTPYYARKFHRLHPEYDGFFRNRRSRADLEDGPDGPAAEPDPPPTPSTGPVGACESFVVLTHGYRICAAPTLPGEKHCATHATA
jgi:hypothetical protein